MKQETYKRSKKIFMPRASTTCKIDTFNIRLVFKKLLWHPSVLFVLPSLRRSHAIHDLQLVLSSLRRGHAIHDLEQKHAIWECATLQLFTHLHKHLYMFMDFEFHEKYKKKKQTKKDSEKRKRNRNKKKTGKDRQRLFAEGLFNSMTRCLLFCGW